MALMVPERHRVALLELTVPQVQKKRKEKKKRKDRESEKRERNKAWENPINVELQRERENNGWVSGVAGSVCVGYVRNNHVR